MTRDDWWCASPDDTTAPPVEGEDEPRYDDAGPIPTAELSNADPRCIRCAPNDCTCRRNAS